MPTFLPRRKMSVLGGEPGSYGLGALKQAAQPVQKYIWNYATSFVYKSPAILKYLNQHMLSFIL